MTRRRSSLKRQSVRRFERHRQAYLKHKAWTFVDTLRLLNKAMRPGGSLHKSMLRFSEQMRACTVTINQAARNMRVFADLEYATRRARMASLLFGVDAVAMVRGAKERAAVGPLSLRQEIDKAYAAVAADYDPYPRFVEFGVGARALREGMMFDRAMKRATVISLERTCGHAPSQWEGVLDDGRHVFIHYRRGHGSIGVGTTLDEAVDATMWSNDEPSPPGSFHWSAASESDPAFLSNGDMLQVLRQRFDVADDALPDNAPGWDWWWD